MVNFQRLRFAILLTCTVSVFCKVCHETPRRKSMKRDNITVGNELKDIPSINPGRNPYHECYVSVVVYNSTSKANGLQGATVTIVSRTKHNTAYNYTGYNQAVTDANGHACLVAYCRAEAIIYVTNKGERLFAMSNSSQRSALPPRFRLFIQSNSEEIRFYTYVFGTIYSKTGPVYTSPEKQICLNGDTSNYHFVFSYISVPDQLVSTPVPKIPASMPPDPRSWQYGTSQSDRFTCYLKIKLTATENQGKMELRSIDAKTKSNYGLFVSGPKYNPTSGNTNIKAACLQFRCPALNIMTGAKMNTLIEGTISIPGHNRGCCLRGASKISGMQANETSFSAVLLTGTNYGPKEGIFKHNNPQYARSRCFTGRDFLGTNYAMTFDNNNALEYDCTIEPSMCRKSVIIG